MGKVSRETGGKLESFLESFSENELSKCSLCKETLTHITKIAESKTGAGTYTISRALSDLINKSAKPHDKVSAKALNNRVRRNEGKEDVIFPKRENKNAKNITDTDVTDVPDSASCTQHSITTSIISARQLIAKELLKLKKLADSHQLNGDELFKEIENQLRLIITEAAEVGICICEKGVKH